MSYEQPLLSVDALIFRQTSSALEVLLAPRVNEPFIGELALPGVLLLQGESLSEAAMRAAQSKAGISEILGSLQFRNFDETNRDPRGATISLVQWVFVAPDVETSGQWVNVDSLPALPFDHKSIIEQALIALRSPSQELARGILGDVFSSGEYASLLERAGTSIDRTNLMRIITARFNVENLGLSASRLTGKRSHHWRFVS